MLVAIAVTGCMAGCSDDNDVAIPDNELDESAVGYAEISLMLPNGDASTRTDAEAGDGVDVGTADEYRLSTATLYFVNVNVSPKVVAQVTTINLPANPTVNSNFATYPSQKIALPVGSYNMYVAGNGTANGVNVGTLETDLQESLPAGTINPWQTTAVNNTLPMASRSAVASSFPVTISASNNSSNPVELRALITRSVAKITLKSSSANANKYAFDLMTTGSSPVKVATVTINGYRMLNLQQTAFTFRHMAKGADFTTPGTVPTYGYGDVANGLTAVDYIMDPNTYLKTATPLAAGYTNWYVNTKFSDGFSLPSSDAITILGYCQENTMYISAQKKGYGTAVMFKAAIVPETTMIDPTTDTYTAGNDLFYYNGKFYTSYDKVRTKVNSDFSEIQPLPAWDNTIGATNSVAYQNMVDYGVTMFKNGNCTYTYYIKHMDNALPTTMGVMEYGVVRNNVYNVNIKGIAKLGKGVTAGGVDPTVDPDNPADPAPSDPNVDPNEDIETAVSLIVTLTVKPWYVRNNDTILGN